MTTSERPTPAARSRDAATLEQKFFSDSIEEISSRSRRLFWEGAARRGFAYLLKTVSIFGAIIVAAKIDVIPQTALGIIIAAAIGLDQLTSNHARLMPIV